jgi:hypothetical protein
MFAALSHSLTVLGIGPDPDAAIYDATWPTNHDPIWRVLRASDDVVACYAADVEAVRVRVRGGVAVLA